MQLRNLSLSLQCCLVEGQFYIALAALFKTKNRMFECSLSHSTVQTQGNINTFVHIPRMMCRVERTSYGEYFFCCIIRLLDMETTGNITIIESVSRFKKVDISLIENERIDCTTLGVYTKLIVLGKKWNLNVRGLRKHLGLSDEKVRKSLSLLEQEGYIVRTPCRNEKGQLVGWDYAIYPTPVSEDERSKAGAGKETPNSDIPSTPKSAHSDKGGLINNRINGIIDLNNGEKEKSSAKKKEKPLPFEDEELRKMWEELVKYPDWQRKTDHAIDLRLKQLARLAKGDVNYARAIMRQTLEKGWQDFYDVKGYKPEQQHAQQPRKKTAWEEMGITEEQYRELIKK